MRKINSPFFKLNANWMKTGTNEKTDGLNKSDGEALGLRRLLVSKMALGMLLVAALLLPLTLIALTQGQPVPLILTMLVFGVSAYDIVISGCGSSKMKSNTKILVESLGLLAGGGILTLADPTLMDPGLAIMVLAPVHFVLVSGRIAGKGVLLLMILLSIFSGVSAGGWLPNLLSNSTIIGWIGAVYCIAIVFMQVYIAYSIYQFSNAGEHAHNTAVRHLAEQMGDGYVRFSSQGKVLFASPLTQKLLRASRFDLTGQGILDRVHVLDRPMFLKGLSDALHNDKSEIIEARLRKDNVNLSASVPEYIWIEVYFSAIADLKTSKENWQIIALLRDVTNRKDHEFELIDARKNAEQASSTKSGFLATIGHELRTPLNAIVGFSEMMSNGIGGKLEPTHEEYAKLIFQSGHHLLDVVNMLLDMSKIEAGKFELHLTEFEPQDLVRICIQMMETSAAEKGVKLIADLPEMLPSITGDERATRQILINLLSNAVKFSSAGSKVTVRLKRQGQKLSLSVADTGIGMTKESADRVGEAFFQAHDGLARQYEGTGLGLSIVKGLVDLHEGSIHIASKLDQGTTISILLPIHGPQSKFVEPEIITPLVTRQKTKQLGHRPQKKRIAI